MSDSKNDDVEVSKKRGRAKAVDTPPPVKKERKGPKESAGQEPEAYQEVRAQNEAPPENRTPVGWTLPSPRPRSGTPHP